MQNPNTLNIPFLIYYIFHIFLCAHFFFPGAGAQSYTATVLHAAQTLGRGLRGLSETVASSLTGPRNHIGGQMGILGSSPPTMNGTEHSSPGIVTVLDLEVKIIVILFCIDFSRL